MKKISIIVILLFFVLNSYSQKINYYQDGITGADNIKAMGNLENTGFLKTFSARYEGTKGTPNLFNSFVTSYLLGAGQEKYVEFNSDIDIERNTVIFSDPSTGKLMEISSDNVTELVFKQYDREFVFRTTKEIKFEKKLKENKFYQLIQEKPYRLILVTFKSFVKADYEPAFNSGRHYDEYRTDRKYYLEDSKGVFHQVILNNINYDCLFHPSTLNRRGLAKLFPDKKELIYRAFEDKPDSVSLEKVISVLNKF
jgi:hypothetical protein